MLDRLWRRSLEQSKGAVLMGLMSCWCGFLRWHRSLEALEGVAAVKAMASGGIVSPSAANIGGKSSVVFNNGGARCNKRKGLPGGHSTMNNIIVKKKLCSSSNGVAKPAVAVAEAEAAAAVKSSSRGGGGVVGMRKKERTEDKIVGDPSLEDAARVLTEFSFLAHKPARSPCPPKAFELVGRQSLPLPIPQWTIRKLRSGRTKRLESSSHEDSHDAIATDSNSPPPFLLQKQLSFECSSSPGGDSQSVITLVKIEDDPLCSSTRVEEEDGQVEQHKLDAVVAEEQQDENNNSRSPSGEGLLSKLTSLSSLDSLLPDSQAEIPNSSLPSVLQKGESASICVVPKFEGSSAGRSAFQRVVPIRPVKKPTLYRKLKVRILCTHPSPTPTALLLSSER